jgi:hypothetical protein
MQVRMVCTGGSPQQTRLSGRSSSSRRYSGGAPLQALLPDPSGTAARASAIRNPLAHGSAGRHSDRELFDVTDELLVIVEFHSLVEAGFSTDRAAEQLRNASRSVSGLWLRRRDDQTGDDEASATFA